MEHETSNKQGTANSDLGAAMQWVAVENGLPDELETVWISNGKGWTILGCLCLCH